MKKVLVFGTFDRLHPGHLYFLKQAKKYGRLFVLVARDKTVKKNKGKLPKHKENERLRKVIQTSLTTSVFLGSLKNKYAVLKKIKPDIICLGYDQKFFIDNLPKKIKAFGLKTKIIRLKAYKPNIYKSSKII
jgi:FAD synthetase